MANTSLLVSVRVSETPIDIVQMIESCTGGSTCGAQSVFLGKVRDRNHGRDVESVFYDAFEPLAERIIAQICEEARAQWGAALRLSVVHCVGELMPGQLSVAIVVASPHRDEAYRASRYVIEEIKVRAPIWKKERYVDGETEWLKGHALCGHSATTNPAASSGEIDYSENHHDQHAHS